MIICKVIGHNYTPNLIEVDRISQGINKVTISKEKKTYSGIICIRCGDMIEKQELDNV